MKNNVYRVVFFVLLFNIFLTQIFAERIVILPFVNKTNDKESAYSDRLTSLVEEQLLNSYYEVINRNDLQKIMEEQKIGTTGIINQDDAIQIGKVAGAKRALLGNILGIYSGKTGNNFEVEVVVDIKIIDVETAILFKTINLKEKSEATIKESAVDQALVLIARAFVLKLTGKEAKDDTVSQTTPNSSNGDKVVSNKQQGKQQVKQKNFTSILFSVSQFNHKNFFPNTNLVVVDKEVRDAKGMAGLGFEIGGEMSYLDGAIYANKMANLYKFGIGFRPKIVDSGMFSLRTGVQIDGVLLDGKVGTVNKDYKGLPEKIDGNKYTPGKATIKMVGAGAAIAPYLRAELNVGENFTMTGSLYYELYTSFENLKIMIEEGSNSAVIEIPQNDGKKFNPTLEPGGVALKLGVQFNY